MKFDAIIIGGGHSGLSKGIELLKQGKRCIIFSLGEGSRRFRDPNFSHKALRSEFENGGGTFVMGDRVIRGDFDDEGNIKAVYTENQDTTAFKAEEYYIATGSFFAEGLIAEKDKIYEPVFGLDVNYDSNPENWVNTDFYSRQPFMEFGVKTDADGHPSINGITVNNLIAIGALLAYGRK